MAICNFCHHWVAIRSYSTRLDRSAFPAIWEACAGCSELVETGDIVGLRQRAIDEARVVALMMGVPARSWKDIETSHEYFWSIVQLPIQRR